MRLRSCSAALAAAFLGFTGVAQAAPEIAASVLPNGRSVAVGSPASVYAVIANSGDQTATGCSVALDAGNSAPVTFSYQTADASLQLTGSADTPVDIPAASNQFFVLTMTPTSAYSGEVRLSYTCSNATALGQPGVNDVQLVAETGGTVTDILSISLTPTNDGVVRISSAGGAEVMTMAAVYPGNGGLTADIRVTPEVTGYPGATQALTICETDSGSNCLATPGEFVDTTFTQGTVKTFGIFVTSPQQGGIPLYPDLVRVRATFADQPAPAGDEPDIDAANMAGVVRSITSSALTAPAPAEVNTDGAGFYRFRIRDMINDPSGRFMDNGELVVLPDGTAVGAMTIIEGSPYRQVFTLSDGNFFPNAAGGPIFGGTLNLLPTPDGASGLSAPFTFSYTPGSGLLGQFDGNTPSPVFNIDGATYFRNSRLALTGLMLSQIVFPVIALNVAAVTGTYDMVDPLTLASFGTLTLSAQLLQASLVLAQGGSSCSLSAPFSLQQAMAVMVMTELVITSCALAGTYSGIGVFDTYSDPGFMVLRLYIYSQVVGFYLQGRIAQSQGGEIQPAAFNMVPVRD